MFEHSLVVRQKSRRRGMVLALAVGLHGAGLATVVLASAWSVGEVPPPDQQAVFQVPIASFRNDATFFFGVRSR